MWTTHGTELFQQRDLMCSAFALDIDEEILGKLQVVAVTQCVASCSHRESAFLVEF